MRFLISDCNKTQIEVISKALKKLYPDCEIICQTDSIMAAKICFYEKFDAIFSSLDDIRIDGIEMLSFTKNVNQNAKFILCGKREILYDWNVIDEEDMPCEEGVDGVLTLPYTFEKIKKAVEPKRNFNMSSLKTEEISDEDLEFVAAGISNPVENNMKKDNKI